MTNARFDAEIVGPSVFAADRLRTDPGTVPTRAAGLDAGSNFHDRAWMELTAHRFDYVILHRGPWFAAEYGAGLAELARELAAGQIPADPDTTIIARDRLTPPARLTWYPSRGFRPLAAPGESSKPRHAALREAVLTVYQPPVLQSHAIAVDLMDVEVFGRERVIRLFEGGREFCRWVVAPGPPRDLRSQPFPLGPGLRTYTFRTDGEDVPTRRADRLDDAATPYSFRLTRVEVAKVTP